MLQCPSVPSVFGPSLSSPSSPLTRLSITARLKLNLTSPRLPMPQSPHSHRVVQSGHRGISCAPGLRTPCFMADGLGALDVSLWLQCFPNGSPSLPRAPHATGYQGLRWGPLLTHVQRSTSTGVLCPSPHSPLTSKQPGSSPCPG